MWNQFKVINKYTWTTSRTSFWCFNVNFEQSPHIGLRFPVSSFKTFFHKFSMQKTNISSFLQELKINWIIISWALLSLFSWVVLVKRIVIRFILQTTSWRIGQVCLFFSINSKCINQGQLEPGQASRVGIG